MTTDDLSRRLHKRIADRICWVSEAPIWLFEEAAGGEARFTCTFPPEAVCLIFRLESINFHFLRQAKSVDWLALLHFPDGTVDAHLIECKRTVGAGKWRDIKEQMESSIVRSLALAGTLETPIRRFYGYTAYRHDRISSRGSPDPILARLPLGPGIVARSEPEETRDARLGQLDWEAGEILLEGVDGPVLHQRIQLDPGSGEGTVELFRESV